MTAPGHGDAGAGTANAEFAQAISLNQSQIEGTIMSKPSDRGLNLTSGLTPIFSKSVCIGFMKDALQARVDIDCLLDAGSIRQRFYRARQCCQERGDHRFDNLRFQIEGFWLSIYWCPTGTPRRHRIQLKFVGETEYCVSARGIIQYT